MSSHIDADLIGIPLRAVVSEKTPAGKVEIKKRTSKTAHIVSQTELLKTVLEK